MSRISGPGDRPIPTSEPTTEAQQTSETESIQKTDISGKAPFDAEETADYHTPSTDTKGQQHESRLGGLARQAELESLLPKHSELTLKDLPDRPNLDPNVHLNEKIDVTKNLPGGHEINTGLKGLDWGSSKEKTGPNHMGVDLTYGGMKAPSDRLDEVLNAGKLGQSNTSAPQKGDAATGKKVPGKSGGSYSKSLDGGNNSSSISEGKGKGGLHGTPPPGELSFRAPNMDLVGSRTTSKYPGGHDVTTTTKTGTRTDFYVDGKDKAIASVEKSIEEGVTTTKMYGENGEYKGKDVVSADGKIVSYDKDGKQKKMTDPDAAGGGGVPTSDEMAKILKGRLGQVQHSINPDLGVSGGPTGSGELKHPIDLLSDPIGDGESSVETVTPEKAKLAADIHGPRTLNPDSGFGGVKPDIKGGANPVPNQGDINKP